MSQLAATRAPMRASAPRPRPRPAGRSLREVSRPVAPVVATTRTRDSRFMGLMIVVAFLAALSMLLLNTMRAEQSFTLSTLRSDVSSLDDQEQALRSEIAAMSAPEQLALKASGYGMVPSTEVTYVSRATGKKLGVAGSVRSGAGLSVNTLPNTPSSRAAGEVIASGTMGLHLTDPVAREKAQRDAAAKKAAADEAAAAKAEAAKKADSAKATPSTSGKPTK